MIYLRLAAMFVWLLISCVAGLAMCAVRWGDTNLDRDFARVFSWGVLRLAGLRVEVAGRERLLAQQPCIYVSNHQSGMDMATFGVIYPGKTVLVGKRELLWIPFFGLFFVAAGNIVIRREKRERAIAGLTRAAGAIARRGVSVWIFPEGTRNPEGGDLLPFKKGAFHMAAAAGVPIVPIVSAPLKPLMDWKSRHLRGGVVRVRVLEPIAASGDPVALLDKTRAAMLGALRDLAPAGAP